MMKRHHAVTMQMGTNTHIFDCGRGYGETKSPSSCKSEKIPQGFLSDIAKLALKESKSPSIIKANLRKGMITESCESMVLCDLYISSIRNIIEDSTISGGQLWMDI